MTDNSSTSQNTMWGGRFASGPAAIMEEINASIGFDRRLARQDIEGSRAHARRMGVVCVRWRFRSEISLGQSNGFSSSGCKECRDWQG